MTTVASIAISVALACLTYMYTFKIFEFYFQVLAQHEAGYIGAMLFVIPGFPFITSMLDISKLDMRSGLERLAYAIMITLVATLVGWLVAWSLIFGRKLPTAGPVATGHHAAAAAGELLWGLRLLGDVQQFP